MGQCVTSYEYTIKRNYVMTKDQSKCIIQSSHNNNMYPLDINLIIGKPQMCFFSKGVSDVC